MISESVFENLEHEFVSIGLRSGEGFCGDLFFDDCTKSFYIKNASSHDSSHDSRTVYFDLDSVEAIWIV